MKQIILILGMVLLTSFNASSETTKTNKETAINTTVMANSSITTDCFAAVSKEMLDEVTRASIKKNSDAIKALIARGYVVILKKGTQVNVVNTGLAVKKIQVLSGSYKGEYFYIASEFVR